MNEVARTVNKGTAINMPSTTRFSLIYSTIALGICSFTFGTNLSLLNAVMDVFMGNPKKGLIGSLGMSSMHWRHAVSIMCAGAFLSNMAITSVAVNRKHVLVLNNLFYITGQAMITLARNSYHVIIARLIIGLGAGITCAIVPLYFQKLAPAKMRGIYGSLHQLSLCTGILCGQVFSFYFCRAENWRVGMCAILGYLALHTLMLCFISNVDEVASENVSVTSLFLNERARKSILTSVLLHGGQQLSGIRAVIFYSNKIFEKKSNPNVYSLLVGLNLIVGTLVSMFVVDQLGRRKMLTYSLIPVIGSLLLLSSGLQDVVGIMGFIIGYSIGLGPIPWFITGEIFPERYKKAGNLVSVSVNWMVTYIIAVFFHSIFTTIGSYVFLVFSSFCLFLLGYVCLFFVETKGNKAEFV